MPSATFQFSTFNSVGEAGDGVWQNPSNAASDNGAYASVAVGGVSPANS